LADPDHPEYKEQTEWLDDDLDPVAFDLAKANVMLGVYAGWSSRALTDPLPGV
jgi:hypothetical protein